VVDTKAFSTAKISRMKQLVHIQIYNSLLLCANKVKLIIPLKCPALIVPDKENISLEKEIGEYKDRY
jgi:hypothetical protein